MSSVKVSFQDSISRDVVNVGKCLGCSTCILTCPFNSLEYIGGKPVQTGECKSCGICAKACPQYEWHQDEAETLIFGRTRKAEEDFGIFREIALAQASDPYTLSLGQDGGAVTALLVYALKEGIIDGAIVTDKESDKPYYPKPILATTAEEIILSAGTKYFYSPSILALKEALKEKKASLAFVGTPCQIRAFRKMEMAGLKKYTASIKLLIGLACSESFNYEGLMEAHIHGKLGINPENIKKMNIKGKMLITLESETIATPISEIKQYARENCRNCRDFSSELADISAGGLGMEKWTFTILRTERGEKLFKRAEKEGAIKTRSVEEEPNALNLLKKLSKKKRQI
jgi:coenzyme F420 hydrogenase subunit beta